MTGQYRVLRCEQLITRKSKSGIATFLIVHDVLSGKLDDDC